MPWPYVLGRIGVRAGVALWRHRLGLIVAGLVVAAFGTYSLTFAGPSVTNGDCADTAMAALTHVNDATAHAAYACLDKSMQTSSEDQFVATMKQRALPSAQANRVADRPTSDGKIVFYTVSANDLPPVGYIVYLNGAGKVVNVE